jgi:hypothetical protein
MGFSRVQAIAVTGLFMVACGGDPAANSPDEQSDDNATADHTSKDAGASKDAGKRDASSDDTSDDSSDNGDSTDDNSTDQPSDKPDASSASKPDASQASDAGSRADAGDAGKPSSGASDAGGSACDSLTYDNFGKMFLSTYCVSCHGPTIAQAKIKLDSLASVTTNKAKVKMEVSTSAMPPLGSKAPTSAERTKLGQFIDCGPK